ncbi:MAG: YraN family protein [Kiloniellales bacterium]|nr:YraN family protein [Kiloniellales bacterium]
MTEGSRRSAELWGRWAEALAAWRLRLTGYRIVARRFRAAQGEVDLVARRGSVLAIVEVKARADEASAADSLRAGQRRRIERAALAFLQRHPEYTALRLRFDMMLIVPRRWPRHIIDAWRPAGGGSI